MEIGDISRKIEQDIGDLTLLNDELHGLLVPPSTDLFDTMNSGEKKLWIIARKDEYCITFDETSMQYGIAFRNILGTMVSLGEDGSIADAYETLISREEDTDDQDRDRGKGKMAPPTGAHHAGTRKSFKPSSRQKPYSAR